MPQSLKDFIVGDIGVFDGSSWIKVKPEDVFVEVENTRKETLAMVMREIGKLKKKPIVNMLQDDEVFDERGMDGVKGFNDALSTLKEKLST